MCVTRVAVDGPAPGAGLTSDRAGERREWVVGETSRLYSGVARCELWGGVRRVGRDVAAMLNDGVSMVANTDRGPASSPHALYGVIAAGEEPKLR